MVGTRLANDRRRSRGFAARQVAGAWSITEFDDPPASSEMQSVALTGAGAVAVGQRANTSRIRVTCPGGGASAGDGPDAGGGSTDVDPVDEPMDDQERARDVSVLGVATAPLAPRGTLGSIRIREVASDVGLSMVTPTWGGLSVDFDKDGWRDVFIGRHQGTPWVGLGGPNRFQRVTGAFEKRDRHGCAAEDVDDDGFFDVYCATGANKGLQVKDNDLVLRAGNPGADQASARYEVLDPFGRGREATFFRLDDDPYPELYVVSEPERVDGLPSSNRLYQNVNGDRFRSIPEQRADVSAGGVCARSGDIDDDGDDDLLFCAVERWKGRGPGLRAFRNDGGVLDEATVALGVPSGHTYDAITADLDRDGDVELVQAQPGRIVISRWQGGDLDVVAQIGVASVVSMAAGDVDGDNDLDLFVVRGGSSNQRDLVLRNRGNGTAFSSVAMPRGASGVADRAFRIDHDRNGLDDFVVLNGGGFGTGPVQLFAFYP